MASEVDRIHHSAPFGDEPELDFDEETVSSRLQHFPWWFLGIVFLIIGAVVIFAVDPDYREALTFIWWPGILLTLGISLASYVLALFLGIVAGLGRISRNIVFRNLATFYVETVRGIPMLVLIFFIAFVAVPFVVRDVLGSLLPNLENSDILLEYRAIVALATTYGAFLAEIFRAGIQSIPRGQMEASRSLGMSYGQAMRHIILPQAVRNVLPALGNDFVAMVKDSSLVSVLAIRDITQRARLYAGRTFRFPEAYVTLTVLYLTIVVILSLLVRILERRMRQDER